MVEAWGVGGGDRPAQRGPVVTPQRVQGFPIWTHLICAVSFPVWSIGTQARLYGIDTRYDWWQGFGNLATLLVLAALIVALPPAVGLEAWAVTHRRPWVARTAVVSYVLIAGLISFVPTGLRFFGDVSATPIDLIMLSLAIYVMVICSQALSAYFVCRLWQRR
jgi:hypothetical protein